MGKYIKKIGLTSKFISKDKENNIELWDGRTASINVEEWSENTPAHIKNKNVLWTLVSPDDKIVGEITKMTSPYKEDDIQNRDQAYYKLRFPLRLCNTKRVVPWRLFAYSIEEPFPDTPGFEIYPRSHSRGITAIDAFVAIDINKGIRLTENQTLKYGQYISLSIETEGMERSDFIIEIYEKDKHSDDPLYTDVHKCREGNIKVLNINTMPFYMKTKRQQEGTTLYQVKVKDIETDEFIPAAQGADCTLTFENGKLALDPIQIPDNTSLTTIQQESLENIKNHNHCKFSSISYQIDNQKPIVVFDENEIIDPESYFFEQKSKTFEFRFDEAILSKNSKEELKSFADYLQKRGLEVLLDGHADSRGPENYNLGLSERRVRAVADYLIQCGVSPDNFSIKAHGKKDQPVKDARNEEEHQKNRIVKMVFYLIGITHPAKVSSIVGHSKEHTHKAKLTVGQYKHKNCLAEEEHDSKIHITPLLKNESEPAIPPYALKYKKDNDEGTDNTYQIDVYAPTIVFPGISNLFTTVSAEYYNEYRFRLNTCAYYPRKESEAAQLRVYPDTQFVYHGLLNPYDMNYRIDNLTADAVPLQQAVTVSDQQVDQLFDIFFSDINGNPAHIYTWLKDKEMMALAKELTREALNEALKDYQFDIHTLSDFIDNKPLSRISHFEDYKEQFKYITLVFVVLYIIIEILLIYFSGGNKALARFKQLEGKVKKLDKAVNNTIGSIGKVKLVDISLDLDVFKIATAAQMKYAYINQKMIPHYTIELNINPLVGISLGAALFKFDGEMDSLASNPLQNAIEQTIIDKLLGWMQDALKVGGKSLGLSLDIKLKGAIGVKDKLTFGYADGEFYSVTDKGNLANNIIGVSGGRETGTTIGIEIDASIDAMAGVRIVAGAFEDVFGKSGATQAIKDFEVKGGIGFSGQIGLIINWRWDVKDGLTAEIIFKVYPVYGRLTGSIRNINNDQKVKNKTEEKADENSLVWAGTDFSILKIPLLSWLRNN